MAFNASKFHLFNVVDTCAVWNILSSPLLYVTARRAGVHFCCTSFVLYECLYKPRKKPEDEKVHLRFKAEAALQQRLQTEITNGAFREHHLTIEDLQDVSVLESRRNLSKGELSSIAFANKTNQAFITDDKKARRLADEVMAAGMAQTTPHLLAWLLYNGLLLDGDKVTIVEQHEASFGCLAPHFEVAYHEALRCQLMVSHPSDHA